MKLSYVDSINQIHFNGSEKLIYGAGYYARKLYDYMVCRQVDIKGFLVSKADKKCNEMFGMPIYESGVYINEENSKNTVIYVAVSGKNIGEIVEKINESRVDEVVVVSPNALDMVDNRTDPRRCRIASMSMVSKNAVIWSDSTSEIVIDEYVSIDEGVKIFAYNYSKIHIGKYTHLDCNVRLFSGNKGEIDIEEKVVLNKMTEISASWGGKIRMGDNVACGKNGFFLAQNESSICLGSRGMYSSCVNMTTGSHHILNEDNEDITNRRNIEIGKHVWIGVGATVLAGAEIGEDSIVGASSVVTGKVGSNATIVGAPARENRKGVFWTY